MLTAPTPRMTPVRSVNARISHPFTANSFNPAYEGDPNHVGSYSSGRDARPRLKLTQGYLCQGQNRSGPSPHTEGNGSSPVPVTSCKPGSFSALLPSWSRDPVAWAVPRPLHRTPPS